MYDLLKDKSNLLCTLLYLYLINFFSHIWSQVVLHFKKMGLKFSYLKFTPKVRKKI